MNLLSKKIFIIALITVFIFIFIAQCFAGRDALAMVTGIYGQLQVTRQNENINAKMRMPLFMNDQLSTSGSSKAVLLLKDGSEVKMGPDTKLTIQDNNKKRGLLVTLGKIFAKMVPQKSSFQVLSPYGAAAIEGTEFQVEATKKDSTLTVVDGKVRFSNSKNKVLVAQSGQTSSDSLTKPIPSPKQVDAKRITQWQDAIRKYYDAIENFMSLYEQIQQYKQSHYGAVPVEQMDQLNYIIDTISSMVPDVGFEYGHNCLRSAFDWLKQACYFTEQSWVENAIKNGNLKLNEAKRELSKYKAQFQKAERDFLNSP